MERRIAQAMKIEVMASIDGHLCERSQVLERAGQLVYAIKVATNHGGTIAVVSANGRMVSFWIGDVP